jgi:hypothetical protein
MDLNIRRAALLMLLMAGMLMSPTDLSSCGPFIMRALFSTYKQPEQTANQFARGQLGVLQPSYPRFYLFIAYRYLTGVPLNVAEQKALFPPAQNSPASAPTASDQWLEARKKVAGAGEPPKIEVEKTVSKPTEYYTYPNCLDDAFRSAMATLAARVAKFGAASPTVTNWVKGQDAVFANCAGEPPAVIPPAAPSDSDAVLKADRAYQIAAAQLYAGNLDQAESLFSQIAADKSSPWRPISAYLVARVEIRKGTIQNDPAALKKAEAQLKAVLGDASCSSVHPAAKNLAELVRSRLQPAEQLTNLAQLIVKPDATLDRDLTDYRFLYDKFEDGRFGENVKIPLKDDLSDWLFTFHNHGADHAVEKWRATKSLHWLLATLQDLHAGSSGVNEALAAADGVRPDSPAFLTAAFHANRLIIESHRDQDARNRLDALLKDRAQYPVSAVNLLLAERMKVAANWDEFLRYAQRVPVGIEWDEGEDVSDDALNDSPLKEYKNGKTTLDVDGAKILNEQTPLRKLAASAAGSALPANLRDRVALAAWMRAVMIGDEKTAADLTPVLASLAPALKDRLGEYSAAPDKDRRLFAFAYLALKYPGVRPVVESGFARLTAIEKVDDFRDNWWCSLGEKEPPLEMDEPLKQLYVNEQPVASFLPAADRSQAAEEWKRLAAIPTAPNYLAALVIAYAKAHGDDPRAPEALHLAVRATRFGCTDDRTGALSKQAYDLLHARYPNSEWAKQFK